MTYSYSCKSCGAAWDCSRTIERRDEPCFAACPHCEQTDCVTRTIAAPAISYAGGMTVLQRAGSGWNDVLNKVKKSSGRQSKIETR